MSTATQSSSSDTHRYVDYDEFIDFQVQKTRAGIKSNDLLTAFIGAAVGVLAYVLVFAVFDHWVIDGGFSRGPRIALLSVLVAGLSGWFVWKLAVPYFRSVSALYAAREIEQTEPAFRSTLLTLIDLKRSGRTVSPEIRAVLEKRAGLGLTHMNIEQAVDRRLLMRLSYVLLGLVVVTCLYTVLSPKELSNSLWRSLLPTSSVAVDTRTQIERVEPGNVDVLARSQLPVTAELSGVIPEEVTLLYSTADRRLVDEPIAMRKTDDGIRQYRGIITGENGRGILQSMTYRVVAGDATSDTYSVTVSQPPSANVDEVEYEYPQYMGFRNRVQIGGAIDAWEGTWVTVRATANMPIESAMVKFSDTDDITRKAEELPVEIENGTLLTARWQLRIRPDGTFPNFYRIQCRNEAGKIDPSPSLHPIKIRPDQPPQIQLARPTSDLERPANAVVPLLYAAQDPDFLLQSVTLRFEKNGESLIQSPRLYESPPARKAVADTYDLDLSQLELKPGDKLSYWLEARDNMEPFADRSGNLSKTPKLNIRISEPVAQEQVEQQRAQDQQELQQRLDELRKECEVGSEASGEQPADSAAAEPDPASAAEEQAPGESSESADGESTSGDESDGAQSAGEQTGGNQQQGTESPSEGQDAGAASDRQRQDGPGNGEQSQQQSDQGQQPGDSSQSDRQGNEEVPFDELLNRLMQKEQQQKEQQQKEQQAEQNPSGEQQPQPGDPPQQREQTPSGEQPQSAGEQKNSGQSSESKPSAQPSAADDSQGTTSDKNEGDQGSDPSSSPSNSESSSSAGETAQPTKQNDGTSTPPRPGEGTEPAADSTNPSVREGDVEQGQPSQDDVKSPKGSQKPSDLTNREGVRREPADGTEKGDPTTTRKDGQSHPENHQPAPEGAEAPPNQNTDPATPPQGENPPGTPPTGTSSSPGQPSGSDQSSPSSNNSPGQPQSGKPGASQSQSQSPSQSQSQSPSQGQPGESQPQPEGGSEKPPAGESQPRRSEGQAEGGKSRPQDANNQTPQENASDAGSKSPSTPDSKSPTSEQPTGTPPQGGEPSPPTDGQASPESQPQGSEPSPSSEPSSEDPGGKPSAPQGPQQGGSKESGGQQKGSGDQQSGGQSEGGGKEPGQGDGKSSGGQPSGGQQSSGSQPGSQPGQGTSQGGSTTAAEGGGSGPTGDQGPAQSPPSGGDGNGDQPQPGDGAGEGDASDSIQGDEPDLEAKRKAANLVLKDLQDQLQRGEIDPQLKEELGVTDQQLREFTERLQQRLNDTGEDTSPAAEARRRQFEETLRNFEFKSTGTEREGGDGPRQATGGFAGPEGTAPLSKQEAVRRYREILNRRSQRSN